MADELYRQNDALTARAGKMEGKTYQGRTMIAMKRNIDERL